MNKENAKYYLALVEALAVGSIIQVRDGINGWGDEPEPTWCLPANCYRIKPEYRKAWVWWPPEVTCNGSAIYSHIENARSRQLRDGGTIQEITECL